MLLDNIPYTITMGEQATAEGKPREQPVQRTG